MSETGGALAGAPPDCAAVIAVHPAPHVHFTTIDATTIVLDLKRDKYLAVDASQFARLFDGAGADAATPLRAQLLADGVVIHAQPGADADDRGVTRQLITFLAAALWAEWHLRTRRLDLAVVSLRRAQLQPRKCVQLLSRTLNAFRVWRPWYPRKNVCLFDSLALARFLILAGHRIELVFGVRVNSFAAHCWVEAAGSIVNDEPQYCAAFQEIARIH